MAAPTVQGIGSIAAVTTGNLTVTLPTHALNDIVVVQMGYWGPNSAVVGILDIPAAPSGWTLGPTNGDDIDGMVATYWIRAGAVTVANPAFTRPSEYDTGTDTCWWGRAFVIRGVPVTESTPWRNQVVSNLYSSANGSYPAVAADSANDRLVLMTILSLDNTAHGVAPSGWTDSALAYASTTTGTDGSHSATSTESKAAMPVVASAVSAVGQGWYSFIALPFIGDVATAPLSETGTTNLIATDAGSTEILLSAQTHSLTTAQAAAELLAGPGVQTTPSSQSAAERVNDAGTNTVVASQTAADTAVSFDSGTNSQTGAQSAAETVVSSGTNTLTAAHSGVEPSGMTTETGTTTLTAVHAGDAGPVLSPRVFYPGVTVFDSGFPAMAIGDDGTTLHTWCGEGSNMTYRRSSDNGQTWTAKLILGVGKLPLERPIWVSGQVVHVVYENSGTLYYRRSTDGGDTFATNVTLHSGNADEFYRLAFGNDGTTIHLVYAVIKDPNLGGTPAWQGQMFYRKSTDNGATWSAPVEPYPNGADYSSASRPNLSCSGNTVHLVWSALRTGDGMLRDEEINTGRSVDGGATWQPRVIHKGREPSYAHRPDIQEAGSTLVLVWQESYVGGSLSDLDLYMRRSTDNGDTWGPRVRLTNVAGSSEHAFLSGYGDNIGLAWAEYETGTAIIRARFSNDAGVTWSDRQDVYDNLGAGAPVVQGSSEFVYVAFGINGGTAQVFRADWDAPPPSTENLIDNFNRPNEGPPPSASWANGIQGNWGGTEGVVVLDNTATRQAGGVYRQGSWQTVALVGPDVDIIAEVAGLPISEGDGIGVYGPFNDVGPSLDGYGLWAERFSAGAWYWMLFRWVDGVLTANQGPLLAPLAIGDLFGTSIRGNVIRFVHKPVGKAWVIRREIVDSTFAVAGRVGLEFTNNQEARVTNFWATTAATTFVTEAGRSTLLVSHSASEALSGLVAEAGTNTLVVSHAAAESTGGVAADTGTNTLTVSHSGGESQMAARTPLLDDFNRADDLTPPPGASWASIVGYAAGEGLVIVSNAAARKASGSYRQGNAWTPSFPGGGAHPEVWLEFSQIGTTNGGFDFRVTHLNGLDTGSVTAGDGWHVEAEFTSTQTLVGVGPHGSSGSWRFDTGGVGFFQVGDFIRFRFDGARVEVARFRNGVKTVMVDKAYNAVPDDIPAFGNPYDATNIGQPWWFSIDLLNDQSIRVTSIYAGSIAFDAQTTTQTTSHSGAEQLIATGDTGTNTATAAHSAAEVVTSSGTNTQTTSQAARETVPKGARVFGAANTDRITLAGQLKALPEWTFAVWHFPTARTNGRRFWSRGPAATTYSKMTYWGFGGSFGDGPVVEVGRATADSQAISGKVYTLNQWYMDAVTFESSDGTRILGGTLSAAVAEHPYADTRVIGSGAPGDDANVDFTVGNIGGTPGNQNVAYEGRLAYFAVWDVKLTAAELEQYRKGELPRQDRLVVFARLDSTSDLDAAVGGLVATNNGSTFTSAGPLVDYLLTGGSGTNTATAVHSAAESTFGGSTDSGTNTQTAVHAAAERADESATNTLAVSHTSAALLVEAGTNTLAATHTGTGLPVEAGANTSGAVHTAAERVDDAGASTLTASHSGAETGSAGDTGTNAAVAVQTAAEQLVEAATSTATAAHTGAEAASAADAGTNTLVSSQTGTARADEAASSTLTVAHTAGAIRLDEAGTNVAVAAHAAAEGGSAGDTDTTSMVASQTATERLTDAATNTAVAAHSAAEAANAFDSGTTSQAGTQAAAEQLLDAGTNTAAVSHSSTESGAGAETGATSLLAAQTAAETLTDAGASTAVAVHAADARTIEAGTTTSTAAHSGAESGQSGDVGTTTLSVAASAVDRLYEAGTTTLAALGNAVETLTDAGATATVSTQTGLESAAGADIATTSLSASHSGAERYLDAGTSSVAAVLAASDRITETATTLLAAAHAAVETRSILNAATLVLVTVQSSQEVAEFLVVYGTATARVRRAPSATGPVARSTTAGRVTLSRARAEVERV